MIDYYDESLDIINNKEFYNNDSIPELNQTFLTNDIIVYYSNELDGGGISFGQQISVVLKNLYPNRIFNNCFEWCSGPGFIGFNILSSGICQNLCLGDIFKPALQAVEKTVENLSPKYQDRVKTIHMHSVEQIAEDNQFDLIVSNPPHFNSDSGTVISKKIFNSRISDDAGWQVHKNFFKNIKKNLAPEGVILLQENTFGSGPELFEQDIKNNGLRISRCFWNGTDNRFYYLVIQHA